MILSDGYKRRDLPVVIQYIYYTIIYMLYTHTCIDVCEHECIYMYVYIYITVYIHI